MEFTRDLMDDVFNIIEGMASVYDIEKTTLKEFLRDVKHSHSVYVYLYNNTHERKIAYLPNFQSEI